MKKKIIINLVLSLCVVGLIFACYRSVWSEIEFDEDKAAREAVVIAHLMKIKDAEEKFRLSHKGQYCGTIDSLIDWVKNERAIDKIIKEGELTDDQLEAGMTEVEAVKKGLIKRDTIWIAAYELLGISNPDSLKFVPVGKQGGLIELRKKEAFNLKSNEFDMLLEVRASLDDYLDGLDVKQIKALKSELKDRSKNRAPLFEDNADHTKGNWYGLRIGDLEDTNNKLAGNW